MNYNEVYTNCGKRCWLVGKIQEAISFVPANKGNTLHIRTYECSSIFYITNRLVRCASLAADFRLADGRGWVWQPCFNSKSQNVTPGLWSLVHNYCASGSQSCCNIHYLMAGLQSQKWPFAAEKDKTTLCSIPGSTGTTCVHVTISINHKATFWASFTSIASLSFQVSLVDEQGSGKARPWNRDNFTENLFTFSH